MMTVKQVSNLTGVSVRTLQFYDEIGLFKPTKMTDSGYRLYDENALETLQQILFFKELDFTLKEIKAIMENPHFDKIPAYKKQKELIQLKRDRLNDLLELLDKLIKGETCMEFKDFDMSEYLRVLCEFKKTHTDEIVKQLGSVEYFDEMMEVLKSKESKIAEQAVRQYGSMEAFTNAMEKNLGDFLADGSKFPKDEVDAQIKKTEEITRDLTADLTQDPGSPKIQKMVGQLVAFADECNKGIEMGQNYWKTMAEHYLTNPIYLQVNDKKYGEGASRFIGLALKAYLGEK